MSTVSPHGAARGVALVAGVAIAYALLGKLALLLAIPPGYATAIFPSAGMAVAAVLLWGARVLPGVMVGSFLLNSWVNLESGLPLFSIATVVALTIGCGALAQAALGAALVRRFSAFPSSLADEREVASFFLLAGPVACLVGASVGVASLFFGGVITEQAVGFSWMTWWAGDVIGVLITAPLMLILFAKPRPLWRPRLITVAIPLLAACAVVVAVYFQVSKGELERQRLMFREESALMLEAINSRFEFYAKDLVALERFITSSRSVDRDGFRTFVANSFAESSGLQALEWLPRVTQAQRPSFEEQMRAAGHHQFTFTERDQDRQLITAAERSDYFPVIYVEPYAGNEKALGYDVASSTPRRLALLQARDSGTLAMTEPLTLVQRGAEERGALLFMPVYEAGALPTTIPQRRQRLKGVVLGVFIFRDLIEAALDSFPKGGYQLRVEDVTAGDGVPVYGTAPVAREAAERGAVAWEGDITIGARQLRLSFTPTAHYLNEHRSLQAWMVLAWGLLFASLLGAFLLLISGRAGRVQQLVDRQTLELRSILDNVLEVIITFDGNGLIHSVNPAAERLLGRPRAELEGVALARFIPEAGSAAGLERFVGTTREVDAIHSSGTRLPVEFGVSEVVLPERRFYTGIVRDLRERKKVERMKNEFIATVSHELRTPITSIRGALGLIDGGAVGEVSDKVAGLIKVAAANSVRLVTLINDILDVEKLEFGDIAFDMQRHDLCALARTALEHNGGFARQYNITLEWQGEAGPLWVSADEQRMAQALANLISNAVKFSPAGAVVTVTATARDGWAELQVIDRGPGIAAEHHGLIFEKFGQVDASDSRKRGGTGLGLNITKTIVEKMGGEIGFNSVVGEGSTFYIRLPLAAA